MNFTTRVTLDIFLYPLSPVNWINVYDEFKFYFLLFLGIVMYDNEFETKENKIWIMNKIEPQHIHHLRHQSKGVYS